MVLKETKGRVNREPLVTVTRLQWVIIVSNNANFIFFLSINCGGKVIEERVMEKARVDE